MQQAPRDHRTALCLRSPWAATRASNLVLGDVTIIVKASAENTAGSLTVFEEVPPLGDVPHAHSRVVPGAGRLLGVTSPAGFDGFFRALAETSRAGALHDDEYLDISVQHGIQWVT